MNIIKTKTHYNSDILTQNIYDLLRQFPFLDAQIIGNSVLNKPIYCIKIGIGSKQVFYSASFHANESITSLLLMKFIEDFCTTYTNNQNFYGYSAHTLFNNYSIFIAPMVNPDGADLVNGNLSTKSSYYIKAKNISRKFPGIPFPDGWKANIRGVDLNLQFPAGWENSKKIKFSQGFTRTKSKRFCWI